MGAHGGGEGQGVPAALPAAEAVPPPDLPEVEGTRAGLVIRLLQAATAATVLALLFAPATFEPELR